MPLSLCFQNKKAFKALEHLSPSSFLWCPGLPRWALPLNILPRHRLTHQLGSGHPLTPRPRLHRRPVRRPLPAAGAVTPAPRRTCTQSGLRAGMFSHLAAWLPVKLSEGSGPGRFGPVSPRALEGAHVSLAKLFCCTSGRAPDSTRFCVPCARQAPVSPQSPSLQPNRRKVLDSALQEGCSQKQGAGFAASAPRLVGATYLVPRG